MSAAAPRPQPSHAPHFRLPVFGGALLVCLGLVLASDYQESRRLERLREKLRSETERSQKFPHRAEALESMRLRENYRARISLIDALQASRIRPAVTLSGLGQAMRAAPKLHFLVGEFNRGKLQFSGFSPSPETLQSFASAMEKGSGLSCKELPSNPGVPDTPQMNFGMLCQPPAERKP